MSGSSPVNDFEAGQDISEGLNNIQQYVEPVYSPAVLLSYRLLVCLLGQMPEPDVAEYGCEDNVEGESIPAALHSQSLVSWTSFDECGTQRQAQG